MFVVLLHKEAYLRHLAFGGKKLLKLAEVSHSFCRKGAIII